ncbi:hypothetical protein DCC62_05985 [candidate division KSB1 bacterium]|nr:MAG: hypothetical protein DCC62_05985 [candidate division KSB1 bacterium]
MENSVFWFFGLNKGGSFGNTLRIKPPMCITKGDADFLSETLDKVLGEVEVAQTEVWRLISLLDLQLIIQ